ncbi:hypothetical protein ACFOUP_05695 [Belliella kenyensis]|uniref:Uncharacterized protein n=1 Tax=Belliella kenyensis TaxID=1472724 RepID=A0ABV8EKH3_9BACT|nr:hypothetical protein [Belliella kenyensis]MDN3602891.1 hypothetical protein [Belliella kenyensis]
MRESHNDLSNTFKDSYIFEFLNLPEPHSESATARKLAVIIWNDLFRFVGMVVKGIHYENPEGYLFLDQKNKCKAFMNTIEK